MLERKTTQSQKTSGSLVLSSHMQKRLSLLSLSSQMLQHEIAVEIEHNPALELVVDVPHESLETITENQHRTHSHQKEFEFIENMLSTPETLSEHLIWQLRMEDISDRDFLIGTTIINNLDEYGFFLESPYTVCRQLLQTTDKEVFSIISLLQELDPVGCASEGIVDSLRVQISLLDIDDEHRAQLHLFLKKIGSMLQKEISNIGSMIEKAMKECFSDDEYKDYLKVLVPYPGRAYIYNYRDKEVYVIPDAVVQIIGDDLAVTINDDIIPVLSITETMQQALYSKDKEEKNFASKWVQNAEAFIQGLEYRSNTLEKVISYIVQYQCDYFFRYFQRVKADD